MSDDALARLGELTTAMAKLIIEHDELESKLKETTKKLRYHQEVLVPELMGELGLYEIKTQGGLRVEVKEEVRASLPKDGEKREAAFQWLRETGNDGIIKREFRINYGRDSSEWADEFAKKLEELNIEEHASIEQKETIHQQTLLSFLRGQLAEGTGVPLEHFGAFVQRFAKIKL